MLAPDHLDQRAELVNTPPGRTLEAADGRQALQRRRFLTVHAAGEIFSVPLPTLLGALIIKARVCARSSQEKHQRDLARLLALIEDIEAVRAEMSPRERKYLRARSELRDSGHVAWNGIPDAEDAIIALERLSEPNGVGT